MQKKQIGFKTKGMNRDLSVSAYNPEFAFENMNLRLSTNEGNTLMSWVNEKGTALLSIQTLVTPEYWSKEGEENVYVNPEDDSWTHHDAEYTGLIIQGTPIGTAVINHKLVLFTTTTTDSTIGTDYIYELVVDNSNSNADTLLGKVIFSGNLNFSTDNPLETLVSYEAEDIQKIYWVDGKNQPRVLNLMDEKLPNVNNSYFDFIRELALNEKVAVKKLLGANGIFASGVIQYAFTYYTKNGQESNIFYTTPLNYVSPAERGASPEEKVSNAFNIVVSHLDMSFDYLRIYSIQRTSINGTPVAKRVQDLSLKSAEKIYVTPGDESTAYYQLTYIDNGTGGNTIDPTELLFKGGKSLIANTLEQKDATLFLGNLKLESNSDIYSLHKTITDAISLNNSNRTIYSREPVSSAIYEYYNQLNFFKDDNLSESVPCGGFKRGDFYRCGVQFQYKTGEWSDPFYKEDFRVTNKPDISIYVDSLNQIPTVSLPTIQGSLNSDVAAQLIGLGYTKVRPVVVFPEPKDRVSLCQGVVCPTIGHGNTPTERQSSYFFRTYGQLNHLIDMSNGTVSPGFTSNGADVEAANSKATTPDVNQDNPRRWEVEGEFINTSFFKIDNMMCSFHSPDIEFDTQFNNINYTGLKYKNVGNASIYKTLADINIQTETPVVSNVGSGFEHIRLIGDNMHGIVSGLFYEDMSIDDYEDGSLGLNLDQKSPFRWLIYPWQGEGSLNNDINRPADKGTQTSKLKKKVISNLRYSNSSIWEDYDSKFNPSDEDNTDYEYKSFNGDPQLFSNDEVSIVKVKDILYQGNIDTLFGAFDQIRTEILADEGGVGKSDGLHGQHGQHIDLSVSGPAGHDVSAEMVDITLDENVGKRGNSHLDRCRHTDFDDLAHDLPIDLHFKERKTDSRPAADKDDHDQNGRYCLRDDRGPGNPGNSHMKNDNEDQVKDGI